MDKYIRTDVRSYVRERVDNQGPPASLLGQFRYHPQQQSSPHMHTHYQHVIFALL